MFYKGDRVLTPKGPGAVNYVRNAPPDYSKPEAVSVILDLEKVKVLTGERRSYDGTIFAAADVIPQPN